MIPNIKTYFDKKINIFSFGASVTVKQPFLLLNICIAKMKSNLKNIFNLQKWHQNSQLQIFIQANINVRKKLQTCQEQPHLVSGHFMKVLYKTTTCPRLPLLSGPKWLSYTGLTVMSI